MIQLVCSKDRSGQFRRGEVVAEFTLDATTKPYGAYVDPPPTGAEMATGKKRTAAERILDVIAKSNVGLAAADITRMVNEDAYRLPTEGELAHRTVENTLGRLTGISKVKEPTGVAKSYRILYAANPSGER